MIEDFYPTPLTLIWKLIDGLKFDECRTVLEPSAGKGDICEAIQTRLRGGGYSSRPYQIDVIEINPDLQATLRGKEFNLVHDDFLTFQTNKPYDAIIANFPFSQGDEHLIHAIELVRKNGGKIAALVNAETIRNPYTQRRQLLKTWLDQLGAEIELLKDEFLSAERKTSVEVALVRIAVERQAKGSLILDHLQEAETVERDATVQDQIVEKDFVSAMVSRFDLEAKLGIRLIDEYWALRPHIQRSLPKKGKGVPEYDSPTIELKVKESYDRNPVHQINEYLTQTRRKYWAVLIHDPRYTGQYTSNIREDLDAKLTELTKKDFSKFNIEQLAKDLRYQLNKGVETAILALFDKLTRGHSWGKDFDEGNVWLYNGWKTNKVWKVNKKVIIPLHGAFSWSNTLDYRAYDDLADMAKVFDFLSTDKACERLLAGMNQRRSDIHAGDLIDLRYFDIKIYKKGTCHIRFKDLDLLDKFNIFASQRKGWLPPRYGKVPYGDMTAEEKTVVDSFQGKSDYEKVMENSAYFIVDDAAGLLGTGGDE